MSRGFSRDYLLEIQKGNIAGHSSILKFGRNEAVANSPVPICTANAAYPFYPTAAVAVRIFSSVNSANERGLDDIEVFGLDNTGALQSEHINLDGADSTNFVALANTYWRIFRMINRGTTNNEGVITVEATSNGSGLTAGDDAAQIAVGSNQTNMAIYTIPVGKTGYMVHWYASTDKQAGATASIDMELLVRPNSSVSVGEVFQQKNHQGLMIAGSSHFSHPFPIPFIITALSDMQITGETNTSTADVHAGFDIILVDD